MSDISLSPERLRCKLEAAGLQLSAEEIERLLPTWRSHMEGWQRQKEEDLGETQPDLFYQPPEIPS